MSDDKGNETEVDGRIYDEEGRLRGRRLRHPEVIDGVPCGPAEVVRFHANGKLARAELSGPFATAHGVVPRGTLVEVDDAGNVIRVTLSEPAILATKHFSAGVPIEFPHDGPPRIES